MNEEQEKIWECGNRAAWLSMLQQCFIHLGYDQPETKSSKWVIEREMAISTLRRVCDEHGDNDWDENLNLSDIIEKHLWRNLEG